MDDEANVADIHPHSKCNGADDYSNVPLTLTSLMCCQSVS